MNLYFSENSNPFGNFTVFQSITTHFVISEIQTDEAVKHSTAKQSVEMICFQK